MHTATPEQQEATDHFTSRTSLNVQAGAGTGKTTCLEMIARSTTMRGTYTAFNKSIVTESESRFPNTVDCRTTHSLAYRAVGHRYRHRLSAARMRSDQIARAIDIGYFSVPGPDGKPKVIQPGYLASLAMRAIANYSNSDDRTPSAKHVPYVDGIDPLTAQGKRTYDSNDRVSEFVADHLPAIWADLCDVDGKLPYKHDNYVKQWELGKPRIAGDYILLDEAQDTAPVMASILRKQGAMQKILVGDSAQGIYEWRGAVDAFSYLQAEVTTYLTQSFRFGPAVAEVANLLLDLIDSPMHLTGLASIPSSVEQIAGYPDAILTRTNGKAMATVLDAQRNGKTPYLMGGGSTVLSFTKAAAQLMDGVRPAHPELACFDTWDEVKEYVSNDPQGDELGLMVSLVEEYGVDLIIKALDKMPRSEVNSDLVVSTAHKAKGREWDRVQLAGDFTLPNGQVAPSPADVRLLYVACTRAKLVLDPYGSEVVAELLLGEQDQAAKGQPAGIPGGWS